MTVAHSTPVLTSLQINDQLGYARSIFETVRKALLLLGSDSVVHMANAAFLRMMEASGDDIIGRSLTELGTHQWDIPVLTERLAHLQRTGEGFEDLEVSMEFGATGTRVVLLLTGRLLTAPHNLDHMALLAIVDVTAERRTAQALAWHAMELERSNRDLEGYAMVASHDLQEPLRKIRAYGDLLLTECNASLNENARDYATRMVSASARMQTLVGDLLRLAVVGTGSQLFARVNLGDVVREVLIDMDLLIREGNTTVNMGPMPTIECDRPQMRQLFQNLISNAIKFRRAVPPVITISTSAAPVPDFPGAPEGAPWVSVRVEDNGIGFEERHAQVIFAPFQRLHGRGKYAGSGIGLTLCRRICERHLGYLATTSTPDVGTVFTVTLPTRQPQTDRPTQ